MLGSRVQRGPRWCPPPGGRAMARGKDPSAARRPRPYVHDPHHPGLARSFARWAERQGLAIPRLSEEQRTVLEAVRRFLAWSGPRPVFRRLAFFVLLPGGRRL